ncbi:MAG: hypothetical protein J1E02_05785 [Coprobacter sp.]|nr:hypothetical protein [Coprobacter sp.]
MDRKKYPPRVPKVDLVEPFYIGNFYHRRSSICKDLLDEARTLLSESGWDGDFTMYYDIDNPPKVRLYFKISCVSTVFLDGYWEEMKKRIQELVPLIIAYKKLRKHTDMVTACWIEANARYIDWIQEDYIKYVVQKSTMD